MIRIFHIHVPLVLIALAVTDAALLYFSIDVAVEATRSGGPRWLASFVPDGSPSLVQKVLFLATMLGAFFAMGGYTERCISDPHEFAKSVAGAAVLAFIALVSVFYVFSPLRIWMSALLPALAGGVAALALSRALFRRIERVHALKPRILVLGAGKGAVKVQCLERSPDRDLRFRCVGFLPFGEHPGVDPRRAIDYRDVRQACRIVRPTEIVVALEERRNTLPIEALISCRLEGTRVITLSDFLERECGEVDVDGLRPSWLVFSDGSAKGSLYRVAKRISDVLVSLAILVLATPIIVLAAIAIRLEDNGPVFYRQERVGLNGKIFWILKFRSMRIDAEKDGLARWATARDSRVTRVGAFIRRVRVDEIPQVWNVLKGDMSFVGPRPERPALVAEIAREVPFYEYRHLVKPGITGWAQIQHGYEDSIEGAKRKLKFDLYYVKNAGLMLDLIIILRTARVVLFAQGSR